MQGVESVALRRCKEIMHTKSRQGWSEGRLEGMPRSQRTYKERPYRRLVACQGSSPRLLEEYDSVELTNKVDYNPQALW